MKPNLPKQLLAAGVFFGIVFGLAFLSKATGAPAAPPSPHLEAPAS